MIKQTYLPHLQDMIYNVQPCDASEGSGIVCLNTRAQHPGHRFMRMGRASLLIRGKWRAVPDGPFEFREREADIFEELIFYLKRYIDVLLVFLPFVTCSGTRRPTDSTLSQHFFRNVQELPFLSGD